MHFELLDSDVVGGRATTIGRISAIGNRWRVQVETVHATEGWRGRLVFRPDSPAGGEPTRYGPYALRGQSRIEILHAAYQLPEQRLRELLFSLG